MKKFASLISVSVLISALAGCGGGGSSGGDAATTEGVATPASVSIVTAK